MRPAFPLLLIVSLLGVRAHGQEAALRLEAETARSIYSSYATSALYVEARIAAPATATQDATVVRNVAFVLDASGSMAGEPAQALRQALSVALGTLAPGDFVSVVVFGSEAATLQPAVGREELVTVDELLAKIEPAGGAALYDALNQGAAQLRRNAANATLNHLVLVTDGPATKGPRERSDFVKLVEAFGGEGITVSTIGLGAEFEEDLLAEMARIGRGGFRFAPAPGELAGALLADLATLRPPVASEVVLTIDFSYNCEDVEAVGWTPATVDDRTVTYRFPAVAAGQMHKVLAGARLSPGSPGSTVATVRLHWREVADGTEHDLKQRVDVWFDGGTWPARKSANIAVMRSAAGAIVSEGMQRAIERLDKGDLRRAMRELRRARQEVDLLNDDLRDPEIAAKLAVFDIYLAEVEARGLNQFDRKLLRSGLHNQFDIPTEESKDD